MLPVIDPNGERTFRQIIYFSLLLIPVSAIPTYIGMSGLIYLNGILLSGVMMLLVGITLSRSGSVKDAKRLLQASIIYLPVFFILILLDAAASF